MKLSSFAIAFLAVTCIPLTSLGDTILFGPTSYLQQADTPADFYCNLCAECEHVLEDFEDGTLDSRFTVTATDGMIIGPAFGTGVSGLTDSVDGDDGAVDGVGNEAWSFFSPGNSVTITFDEPVKSAGVVWTDGDIGTMTTFEAFAADGTSLGSVGPVSLSDNSFQGTTAEDAFFGAMNLDGIAYITLTNAGGTGIEIDHMQTSSCDCPRP